VGYQVRQTHRLVQRALQSRIERHGVTLGMWYYLRVLWDRDGLTQRELSRVIGTMEPTTLSAIASMEAAGLVRRQRDVRDRRKMNVFLTAKGRALQTTLLPLAVEVVQLATRSMSERERGVLLALLRAMQDELRADLEEEGRGHDADPG
jgi:MarR family transcriptional regulator, organic hydroperoxide resistance regulator